MLFDYFQSMNVHLMGNLIDIIGYAGQVTDGRSHFRADTLVYLTTHRRLMAKFIDRQSGLFRLRLTLNVVALIEHDADTSRALLVTRQLRATSGLFIFCIHTAS